MNKTVLALAIFAFCLFPQVLSSDVRENNDRELASISLGNLGNIIGGLIGSIKNTTSTTTNTTAPTNSTSSTNTTAPANNSSSSNTTAPANNTSSSNTTAPANNTSSSNTTAPVTNSTSANTTAPANNTSSVNTTAPVNNSTSAVNNTNTTSSTPANNTASTNTTQPSNTNDTSSGVDASDDSDDSSTTAPTTPVNNNWYARNDVDRAAFKDKCLIIHNILRQAVGVPDLTWSDSLAASAQAWAENMAANGFRHSGRTGENIASTTYSTKVTVRLLGLWTKEQDWFIKGCTYPKCSSNGNEVGHYTQMVWEKTTQVGCGFAPGVNKQWNNLCCQYYKAGNVIGQTVYPYTAPAV